MDIVQALLKTIKKNIVLIDSVLLLLQKWTTTTFHI